jgi:hypothetical protein
MRYLAVASSYDETIAGEGEIPAPTLAMFVHLGEGVDDDTWRHHLEQGDHSTWLADGISDERYLTGRT